MIQKYYPYHLWEDYQNGMYEQLKEGRQQRVTLAIQILSNCASLYGYMKDVTSQWPVVTEHVLTDTNRNRKSWLGQAACCLAGHIKEDETREAWKYLSEEQRVKANATADKVIAELVENYEKTIGN